MSEFPRLIRVDILAMPDATASVIYGIHDLFLSAGRDWPMIVDGTPGAPMFDPRIVAATPGDLQVANGVRISANADLDGTALPDVACVPELLVPPGEPVTGRFPGETDWLRRCYEGGALLATACSGAVLLAETGLLRGQEAATHWAYCDMLRSYEGVSVRDEQALVVSGEAQRLVMAGGGTSWLDLVLYLIARMIGVEEAMRVARINLIDWHDIGQQPFASLARARQTDDAIIARCQQWIADHYQVATPVAAMVALSGLPERSFKRRFAAATGMTPLAYVHTLRLEEAKQMLERTELPVEAIANEVGYEDASFFGRLFRRKVQITPNRYRKRFGALRRALEANA